MKLKLTKGEISRLKWMYKVGPTPNPLTGITTTPLNGATAVPVGQTISIVFPMGILSSTINNTNITMSPSPARTTSVSADGKTVTIDPTSNLSASTLYTITVTTNVLAPYGSSYVKPTSSYVFSFTTA